MATIEVRTVSRVPPATGFDIIRVVDGEKIHSSALDALVADGNTVLVVGKTGTRPWRGKALDTSGDAGHSGGFTGNDRDYLEAIWKRTLATDRLVCQMALEISWIAQHLGLDLSKDPELPEPEFLDEPAKEC